MGWCNVKYTGKRWQLSSCCRFFFTDFVCLLVWKQKQNKQTNKTFKKIDVESFAPFKILSNCLLMQITCDLHATLYFTSFLFWFVYLKSWYNSNFASLYLFKYWTFTETNCNLTLSGSSLVSNEFEEIVNKNIDVLLLTSIYSTNNLLNERSGRTLTPAVLLVLAPTISPMLVLGRVLLLD